MYLKKYAFVALISCFALPVVADNTDPSRNFFSNLLAPSSGSDNDFKDPDSRNDVINPISESETVEGYTITSTQYPVIAPSNQEAESGKASMQNAFISYLNHDNPDALSQELQSPLYEELVGARWTKNIFESRKVQILTHFFGDYLLRSLAGTQEVHGFSLGRDDKFFYLSNDDAVLVKPDLERTVKNATIYLGKLCVSAAEALATRFSNESTISVSRKEFFSALVDQSHSIKSTSGVELNEELFNSRIPSLENVTITLSVKDNLYTLTTTDKQGNSNSTVMSAQYGPAGNTAAPGSYYTSKELRALAKDEAKSPSEVFADLKGMTPILIVLEYSQKEDIEELFMNNLELTVIGDALAKDPASYSALLVIGKEFEGGIKHWISCVIVKSNEKIQLIITDPANQDRLQDASIQHVKQAVKDGLLKKVTLPKQDDAALGDMFALGGPSKKNDDKKNEEVVNYDAPLAHVPLEELPSLEDLFGGKIPNNIQILLNQLKRQELDNSPMAARLKNCFILYGPPGTGKSTIAQRMARMAGRNVVYAGGGDFRTAYQGSGKAKLDALFAEAKKRGFCVVIIDEIDGTSSKLQPNGSTQEDNRAIKALITTLDQHRHDPDIFVICTTNYPEKIDPAILRRFTSIEIPLPKYNNRKRIFDNFLQQLTMPVETGNNHAVTPGFYDKLISATEGFSGDKIIDMLVNAKYECDAGLPAESSIGFGWRLRGINLSNKSILANLGELTLLPFAPLFHIMPDSEMDKHLYSQYLRHTKLTDDLEELEWKNDPRNLNHKYSWHRYFKIMGQEGFKSIMYGVFSGIGSTLVNHAISSGKNVDYSGIVRGIARQHVAERANVAAQGNENN